MFSVSGPAASSWPKGQQRVAHLENVVPLQSASRTSIRLGQAHELGDAADLQLRHHAPAMHLDGFLDRAEIGGDLLVEAPAHHVMENLALARREASASFSSIDSRSQRSWRVLVSRASACAMADSNARRLTGLTRKSMAPAFMARHARRGCRRARTGR